MPRARLLPLLLAALIALAGCTASGGGGNADPATAYGFVGGNADSGVLAASDRKAIPAITGTTLDGQRLDLASLRGDVVVLNFWASWCPPCRAEAPALEQVYDNTKAQGVRFVGIDTKDETAAASAFVAGKQITYPSIEDQGASIAARLPVPPQGFPSTLVLDRDGRVAYRHIGALTISDLQPVVQQLAAEHPT